MSGWFDTVMKVDCSFRLAMDGALRCLPPTVSTNDFDRGFSGGTCSGAALLVDKRDASAKDTCPTPKYFVSTDDSVCPPKFRVEPIGAANNAASYRYQEGDQCQTSSASSFAVFDLGPESAPTEWVKGTVANEAPLDGLSAAFVVGEDGSSGFFGWVDTKHSNAPCGFSNAADGQSRCLPFDNWGIVWEDLFTDTNCTSFAAAGLYSKCQSGFGRRYDDRGSCNPKFSIHPIVAPYGGGEVFRGTTGSCVGQSVGGDDAYYTTGPEIPATEFSSLKSGDPVGSLRLKRSRSTTSGGWVTGGGFYDSVRSEACSFTIAKDGKLHCMPTGPQPVGYYFADDQCSVPLYRVYEQCGAVVPKYGRDVDRTTCPARHSLFVMGARHTGPVYEKYGQGACTLDDGTAAALILHVRAAEVAPAELVEGSELIPQ